MTNEPEAGPVDGISDVLANLAEGEDLDLADLLAKTLNLYQEAMRKTRMTTVLGADDIRKALRILTILTEVGRMEKDFAKIVSKGRIQ